MSGSGTASTGGRSRTQARRKHNDEAGYFGPGGGNSTAGVKRHAVDKADGDGRAKRKRVEPGNGNTGLGSNASRKDGGETEAKTSLVDFSTMPLSVLYRYMTQFNLVPVITPSPLSPEDPAPPSTLAHPFRHSSRPPSPPTQTTPANRPRRDPREQQQHRRRSLRLVDEYTPRTPILVDLEELNGVIATMVERHFREEIVVSGREEVDTLAAFMCAVEKFKGSKAR
ncbi:hypothetical protein PC9H_004158 [Pleurotus ostreatus]|uniref:Uncharacterized protein n=1 Tax=Pleurotus ostreatus TaxID=5322 RepID=A0A8H7A269_PLEOS|nr:uncharacterized protein PC9H_004158 [Pleurotus ostreatus]KAF7437319.1 hypothetical protein PC9H_004158 [Pleurotus ostreatus]KAJ8703219.1 hypothetical protein PTI98_001861 [Pleurotus ostreatus]